ncbi:hypothetical protein ACLOJK_013699 [Asimina triloba]
MTVNVKLHLPSLPFLGTSTTTMTLTELKKWVENVDTNHDGAISPQELEAALRRLGLWFPGWRSSWAVYLTDDNCNGVIDSPAEKKALMKYAQRYWGIAICDEDQIE